MFSGWPYVSKITSLYAAEADSRHHTSFVLGGKVEGVAATSDRSYSAD